MQKITFTYQRWFLRVFYLIVLLLLSTLVCVGIYEKLPHSLHGFWSNLVFVVIYVLIHQSIMHLYCKYTQNCKYFLCCGEYWVEDKIVFIKTKRTYELENVNAIIGTTKSFRGYAKTGMLKVDFGRKTLTLCSPSDDKINLFSDTELITLFEMILEYNTELKKDDNLEYCYEFKN